MRIISWTLLGLSIALVAIFTLAIAFGGPGRPEPMTSIARAFQTVDNSRLPALSQWRARDGRFLVYRSYLPSRPSPRGSVVLVHGSSATSQSMHTMAQAFADAGYAAYALDMRGHGGSGDKGKIAYVGQLEDDLQDFMLTAMPPAPVSLVGFSSGGGFALRLAAGNRQKMFQSYLLLSPFLHQSAPTQRPDSGGWVSVGVPRVLALSLLERLGNMWLHDLPVAAFAVDGANRELLTEQYSFALAVNFRPNDNYEADIRAIRQPMAVMVGQNDEAFHANQFATVFSISKPPVRVKVIDDLGHIAITLDPKAVAAAVEIINQLH